MCPSIFAIFLMPIIYIILVIFCCIYEISPNNFSKFVSKKLIRKEVLTKIDFQKTKDYYRDILYNHSIIELSYIDDFEINYKKDIISALLSLEMKRKIEITDTQINILNENDTDLKLTEKLIFDNIKDGKVVIDEPKEFEDLLEKYALEEGIENKLLCKISDNRKTSKIFNLFLISILIAVFGIFILFGLFYSITYRYDNNEISTLVAYIYSVLFSVLVPAYTIFSVMIIDIFIYYRKMMLNAYERTDLGNSINEKIEGLKNYIKDYSLLNEKEKEELILWDEYLIYSIQFKQNKKILKNMLKLLKIRDPVKEIMNIPKKQKYLVVISVAIIMVSVMSGEETFLGVAAFVVLAIILNYGNNK